MPCFHSTPSVPIVERRAIIAGSTVQTRQRGAGGVSGSCGTPEIMTDCATISTEGESAVSVSTLLVKTGPRCSLNGSRNSRPV